MPKSGVCIALNWHLECKKAFMAQGYFTVGDKFLNVHGFYRTLPIIIKHTFKSLYFGIQMSKLAFKMQKWHLTFMK